ncbi:hypothetical protein Dsin_026302 [Dipteronia sinensis]|uniref:Uncharacterized protein n=1 Tax=Dipteronia sinensis TaxID=43782 RepID=A0AAD9ZXD1_9ROSI|nr:hypothetical protein Dsin_026302 [Dipteronia sinensis]
MAFLSSFTAKPPQLTFSAKHPVRSSAATFQTPFPAKPQQQQLPFPSAMATKLVAVVPFLSRPPRSSSSVCLISRSSQAEKHDDEYDLKPPQQVDFLTKTLIAMGVVVVITMEFTCKENTNKLDIGRMIKSLFNLMSGPPKPVADEKGSNSEQKDTDATTICLASIVVAVVLYIEFDKNEAKTIDAESIGKVFKSKAKYILDLMGVEVDIMNTVLKEWRK